MNLSEIDAHMQELTPHQLKIVEAVYHGGEAWMTRSKVARALDKRRLTPYDIDCLKMLTERGIIETSTQPTKAPGSDFAYVYHMTDTVASTLVEWSDKREENTKKSQRKPINLVNEDDG